LVRKSASPRHPSRCARDVALGDCYHVVNRGNGRRTVFRKEGDFAAFAQLLCEAGERSDARLLAYCLLGNHFHLLLWPRRDGDLSAYMMWLMTAHVRRYHQHYHSSGHVWQGRFRSFPIQEDAHLIAVHRYIERSPVRAGLVAKAQDWLWSRAAPAREEWHMEQLAWIDFELSWAAFPGPELGVRAPNPSPSTSNPESRRIDVPLSTRSRFSFCYRAGPISVSTGPSLGGRSGIYAHRSAA
jgi:REP element-mobilizing transposase RayT